MLRDIAAILVAAVLLSACATRRPPGEDGTRELSGVVNYEVVRDPNARSVQLEPNQDYSPPVPLPDNPLPAYPHELLHLALQAQEIVIRAVIDEAGDVVAAIPSPLSKGSTGQFHSEFEEAALAALSRWQFSPARIRSFRPSDALDEDGRPDYQILTGESPKKVFIDFQFVFEVQEGRGIVRQLTGPRDTP